MNAILDDLETIVRDVFKNEIQFYHNSVYNPKFPPKKAKKDDQERVYQVTVLGNFMAKSYCECVSLANLLYLRTKKFLKPIIKEYTELEWKEMANILKLTYKFDTNCFKEDNCLVLINEKVLGDANDFKSWISEKYKCHIGAVSWTVIRQRLIDYVNSFSERTFFYFHILIDQRYAGPLIFMLYDDIVPKTCAHFLKLCESQNGFDSNGLIGSPIHRIVENGWIQGGGLSAPNENTRPFYCENYIVPHDRRGVLAMVNVRRHMCNSTQFLITLAESNWMNHRYVAFGQLIFGNKVLKMIESVPTRFDYPTKSITISGFGRLYGERVSPEEPKSLPHLLEYLESHVEDSMEFITTLLDAILSYFEVELIYKNSNGEEYPLGVEELEGEEDDNRVTRKRIFEYLTLCTQDRLEESPREARELILTFQDVIDARDVTTSVKIERKNWFDDKKQKLCHEKVRRVMNEWLDGTTSNILTSPKVKKSQEAYKMMLQRVTKSVDWNEQLTIYDCNEKSSLGKYIFTQTTGVCSRFSLANGFFKDIKSKRKPKLVLSQIQHDHLARRISSDYAWTLTQKETNPIYPKLSIHGVRVLKNPPCITIEEYKAKVKRDKEMKSAVAEAQLKETPAPKTIVKKEKVETIIPQPICECGLKECRCNDPVKIKAIKKSSTDKPKDEPKIKPKTDSIFTLKRSAYSMNESIQHVTTSSPRDSNLSN